MSVLTAREGNGTLTLNGTNQQLVPENRNRLGIIISNFSGVVANLAFQEGASTPAAAATTGIQLASGGSLTLLGQDCFRGEIRVLAASGNIGWVEF